MTTKFKSTPLGSRGEIPPPILSLSEEEMNRLLVWVDQWLNDLISYQQALQKDWAELEETYRARPAVKMKFAPFEGACNDTIPLGAVAVDAVYARLDSGLFQAKPLFSVRALNKEFSDHATHLERFIELYQRHYMQLRRVMQPRLLEFVKLGTMVLKVVYDRDERDVLMYDQPGFEHIIKTRVPGVAGPRILGIHLGDFLFPPFYESIQDCPAVFERQRTSWEKLKVLEAQGKLANVDKIRPFTRMGQRTQIEQARETLSQHALRTFFENEIEVYEGWIDYDVDGDGIPESLVITYHKETRTVLQLRLNWYFHQRKPYVVVPYQVTSDTLYGLGVLEMSKPLQEAYTKWHRMAQDNAYIANIRMFIARKNSGIEESPRLYSGRVLFVDEPTKDLIPFEAGNTYPSTIQERQSIVGLLEKRTGVSDYLVGRESPIVGSRATATSTLALIREGLSRVEEVFSNIRYGLAEALQLCLSVWIQYGTNGVENVVFGPADATATMVQDFFSKVDQANVNGAVAVDLSVTDAATAKQSKQQMQLALVQIMMQYLEKVLAAGQGALQALAQGVPEYAEMVKDVMRAARAMFRDLAEAYDVIDPDKYLPDLEAFLHGPAEPGSVAGQPGGPEESSSLPVGLGPARAAPVPRPPSPGEDGGLLVRQALARAGAGVP